MQILLCCYEYPPIGGGGGVGAQQYAEAWAAAGHEVMVLTSGDRGLATRESVGGVDIVRVAAPGRASRATSSLLSMAWYNISGALHVFRHRNSLRRFDVINCHFSIPTGPVAWFAGRVLRRPNVLTIIGGDIYDPSKKSSPHRSRFFRMVNRWLIAAADSVVAISSDTRYRAQKYYGVEKDIRVINYGFNPPVPDPAGADRLKDAFGGFTLVGIGRLVSRKGFGYAIEAMADVPQDVRLLIIGDGPLQPELQARAAQLGVADRVTFAGYLPRGEIAGCLRRADCFILPSLHEGLGIVVQEAMDASLPVIASNHGGQVDLIHEPRNGLLVPPEDAGALATAIRRLYQDRQLASEMGQHNREDIDNLHIDQNAREYIQVFESVTGAAARELTAAYP